MSLATTEDLMREVVAASTAVDVPELVRLLMQLGERAIGGDRIAAAFLLEFGRTLERLGVLAEAAVATMGAN